MDDGEESSLEEFSEEDYQILESRLHGDLLRICQKHAGKLRLISILGVLDIVKQEIMNLDKINRDLIKQDSKEETENISFS